LKRKKTSGLEPLKSRVVVPTRSLGCKELAAGPAVRTPSQLIRFGNCKTSDENLNATAKFGETGNSMTRGGKGTALVVVEVVVVVDVVVVVGTGVVVATGVVVTFEVVEVVVAVTAIKVTRIVQLI
jgi:hypothetical protein